MNLSEFFNGAVASLPRGGFEAANCTFDVFLRGLFRAYLDEVKKIGDADHSPLVAALLRVTGSKFRHAVAALSASPAVQAGIKTVAKPLAMPASPSQKLRTKASTLGARAKPAA